MNSLVYLVDRVNTKYYCIEYQKPKSNYTCYSHFIKIIEQCTYKKQQNKNENEDSSLGYI